MGTSAASSPSDGSGRPLGTVGGTPIRVLVAVRSSRLRERLTAALGTTPALVLEPAHSGRSAIDLCLRLRPHVLVLDPLLGAPSSSEVTAHLMKHCPTPILVTPDGSDGDLDAIRSCMAAGAVDVLARPIGADADAVREWNRALLAAITVVARIKVVTQHSFGRGPSAPPGGPPAHPARDTGGQQATGTVSVIAIGASTGGPAAITAVLAGLQRPPPVPVLLVLHVNESFHPSLTRWLRDTTGHRVRTAEHGEPIAGAIGSVITGPPGRHLAVSRGMVVLTGDPPRHSCRPSIDVLFESIAREYGSNAAGCLLTGMGRDGAAGLLAMRTAGAFTIAQDEATSVVYGMPAEAARLGAARRILPIDQIGLALSGLATDQRIAGAS